MGFLSRLFASNPKPGRPQPIVEADFEIEVLQSPIPVIVDFWSPTCGPCQVMGGLLNEIGPEFAERLRIVKMNVTEAGGLAAQYGVRGVPTLIAFHDGQPVDRLVGVLPIDQLKHRFEQIAALRSSDGGSSRWSSPSRTDQV
ncbi:MAG: hypothetical protein Kow0074_21710 [Candidatus Zixiibacteriota bacterium]